MYQELKGLIDKLEIRREKAAKLVSSGGALRHQFEINPDDFLQRAEDDYEQGNSINSITNAKRAIHCQIDQVLAVFGFNVRYWNSPRKTELFVRLGFVVPRILKDINDARNVLEHEYIPPTEKQVKEALDIAVLFVNAACRHLDLFMDEFSIGNFDERVSDFCFRKELRVSFCEQQKSCIVQAWTDVDFKNEGSKRSLLGEVYVNAKHELFKDLICLTIAGTRKNKVEKALNTLFDNLEGI